MLILLTILRYVVKNISNKNINYVNQICGIDKRDASIIMKFLS
jgi:hypothetical protein